MYFGIFLNTCKSIYERIVFVFVSGKFEIHLALLPLHYRMPVYILRYISIDPFNYYNSNHFLFLYITKVKILHLKNESIN